MSAEAAVLNHIVEVVLRAQGIAPEMASTPSLIRATHIADRLTPHLLVFREMVEAAEMAGLEGDLLNRAREAHAALTGWSN